MPELPKLNLVDGVKEVHAALTHNYRLYGERVESKWRSLDSVEREIIIGDIHKNIPGPEDHYDCDGNGARLDPRKIFSDWRLNELIYSPEYLLGMIKHRATTSLLDQYITGPKGGPGDYQHVLDLDPYPCFDRGYLDLEAPTPGIEKYIYIMFGSHTKYAQLKATDVATLKKLGNATTKPGVEACFIVPEYFGRYILIRQLRILEALHDIYLNIVSREYCETEIYKEANKFAVRLYNAATTALWNMSLLSESKPLQLSNVSDIAAGHKSALEDCFNLICTEPHALYREVVAWYASRPEGVEDESGRFKGPAETMHLMGAALFEAITCAVKLGAVWNYNCRLVALLQSSPPREFQDAILQELSNTCHMEYRQLQAILKRFCSTDITYDGYKYFKRTSKIKKDGSAHVALRGNIDASKVGNTPLYCLLQLCQSETTWQKATGWCQKLGDLQQAQPGKELKVDARAYSSLGNIAATVTFMQALSSMGLLPVIDNKRDNSFVTGFMELEHELGQLRDHIDLEKFLDPVSNLVEAGVIEDVLVALQAYVVANTGAKLEHLFQDLVDDCITKIAERYEKHKARIEKTQGADPVLSTPESLQDRVQKRRIKEKTRPDQPSLHRIFADNNPAAPIEEELLPVQQPLKVRPSSFEVFQVLLARNSESRGSVAWSAFVAAMVDLGFAVIPKFGSVYTFHPPENIAVQRDLTLHRPHESHIEGWKSLYVAQRLKRVYGWSESTFRT